MNWYLVVKLEMSIFFTNRTNSRSFSCRKLLKILINLKTSENAAGMSIFALGSLRILVSREGHTKEK